MVTDQTASQLIITKISTYIYLPFGPLVSHNMLRYLLCEGLVVSVCLGGAFIGSLFSGGAADGLGRRRAFQLSALPMILGAFVR